jgi:hypothetical protein
VAFQTSSLTNTVKGGVFFIFSGSVSYTFTLVRLSELLSCKYGFEKIAISKGGHLNEYFHRGSMGLC